jgi:exonuclease III
MDLDALSISICCLSECRRDGISEEEALGWKFLFSGASGNQQKGQAGVGIGFNSVIAPNFLEYKAVSNRIIWAKFAVGANRTRCNLHVIAAYAPTELPSTSGDKVGKSQEKEKQKDRFYSDLQNVLSSIPKRDIIALGGDFNAQLGEDSTQWKGTLGQHGLLGENKSNNGSRLLSFCASNDLFLTNTFFRHSKGSKWTWLNP